MTGPACRDIRQALGVYVVGAIDPAERAAVDIHLATCPDCRQELAGLAGLPALLGRVPAHDAERLILDSGDLREGADLRDGAGLSDSQEPPAELLGSLLSRVAERRTARRWRAVAAAAAAVIIAVAGGAAGARLLAPGGHAEPPPRVSATAEVSRATNPRTHVSAVIRYSATSWGTRMDVRVTGIPYGTSCQMWVVNSAGLRLPAGGWTVAYSQRGGQYPASVSVVSSMLRSFEITSDGRVLVTVPAT